MACRTSKIVSENLSERMTEDMSERMTEDMSEEMSKGYVRRYVRKNVKRYVRKMSERMSEDMSERMSKDMSERMVKVERPETIFIGTANQVAKGVEHVWRYKLTRVGAERMYVCMEPPSTTHAGDLMFIMEEVVEGNKWYVAYEGRPVPNAEGEQELEKRAAVFRTSASFWEDGVHEWETNNVRSRATYAEPAQAPQWRASDFMVCTRHEM